MKGRLVIAFIASITAGTTGLAIHHSLAAPGGQHGHGHNHAQTAYGEPGDPKKPARRVEVIMSGNDGEIMAFSPNNLVVKRGEQVLFVMRNISGIDHELVIGTLEENLKHAAAMLKNPDMEHDDPNAKRVSPKKAGEILWRFTRTGDFDFSCLIPGHRESGMSGKIIVR